MHDDQLTAETPRAYGEDAGSVQRLTRAVQELSLARDLARVQEIVRTTARELVGSDGATFVLRDGTQCFYADEDAIEPMWKGMRFPMDSCISGWTMLNKSSVVIKDIYADDRIPSSAYRSTFVKSLAMVPIRSLDPIGAIGNYWADEHTASAAEVSVLQALADATSTAMENISILHELERRVEARTAALELAYREIRALSVTDPLTGLLNRRGFLDQASDRLVSDKSELKASLVAFIDVDGLKEVNDSSGHLAGDALLADFAVALRAAVRSDDLVGRLGGDEFCVFMSQPPGGDANIVRRLDEELNRLNAASDLTYHLSASFGAASSADHPAASLRELIDVADERMYAAKRSRPS